MTEAQAWRMFRDYYSMGAQQPTKEHTPPLQWWAMKDIIDTDRSLAGDMMYDDINSSSFLRADYCELQAVIAEEGGV